MAWIVFPASGRKPEGIANARKRVGYAAARRSRLRASSWRIILELTTSAACRGVIIGAANTVFVMTFKLELTPEAEAGLLAQAQARGLSLETYVTELLQRVAAPRKAFANEKDLVELFAPLRGFDLDFSRNPSTGRPVDV